MGFLVETFQSQKAFSRSSIKGVGGGSCWGRSCRLTYNQHELTSKSMQGHSLSSALHHSQPASSPNIVSSKHIKFNQKATIFSFKLNPPLIKATEPEIVVISLEPCTKTANPKDQKLKADFCCFLYAPGEIIFPPKEKSETSFEVVNCVHLSIWDSWAQKPHCQNSFFQNIEKILLKIKFSALSRDYLGVIQ